MWDGNVRIRELVVDTTLTDVVVADSVGCLFVNPNLGGAITDADWDITTFSSTNDMVAIPSGRVGIGTGFINPPVAKLDVFTQENDTAGSFQVFGDTTGGFIGVFASSTSNVVTSFNIASLNEATGLGRNIGNLSEAKGGTVLNIAVFGTAQGTGGLSITGARFIASGGPVSSDVTGVSGSATGTGKMAVGGDFSAVGDTGTATKSFGVRAIAGGDTTTVSYGIFASSPQASTNAPVRAGFFDGFIETTTASIIFSSDSILKENVQPIQNATEIINKLQPKTFTYKKDSYPMNLAAGLQYGLIAQQVDTVLPDLNSNSTYPARFDSAGNQVSPEVQYMSTNYVGFVPILIAAFQEQKLVIDNQQLLLDSILACCANNNYSRLAGEGADNTGREESNDYNAEVNSVIDIVPDNTIARKETNLEQNHPNPFRERTVFTYSIGKESHVELIIHSYTGQYITTLVSQQQDKGSYTIDWHTADIAAGVYYYSLMVDGMEWVKKAIRIK